MDNNRNFFLYLIMLGVLSIFAWHILPVAPRGGQVSSCRDTTIYNIKYRDTTIYDIERRDSVIIDYTLVPATDFDTVVLCDTAYIAVPIASYNFTDSLSDIWTSGYRVTLDSVKYHFREVTKMVENTVVAKPPRLSVDGGVMMYGGGYIDADVAASLRLGDRWSVCVKAGLTTRDGLSPIAGVGARYRIR